MIQNNEAESEISSNQNSFIQDLIQVAKEGFGTKARNVASTMKEGDLVVPLCSNLEQRQVLAGRGIYPGVDYKICRVENGEAWIKPAYPLREHLERADWPVYVKPLEDVPLWLSQSTYNAGTALGTFALALTNLSIAAFIAYFVRFVYVPTESMIPALIPGDVVLVTRSAPLPLLKPKVGDVAFFEPPPELDQAISESSVGKAGAAVPTKGKQFLKRVVATPGERVGIHESNPVILSSSHFSTPSKREVVVGPYAHPEVFPATSWERPISDEALKQGEYFTVGDNGARSVDSRVWGPLKDKYLIGTVKWVVYPPEHFGPVIPANIIETGAP